MSSTVVSLSTVTLCTSMVASARTESSKGILYIDFAIANPLQFKFRWTKYVHTIADRDVFF